MYTTCTQSLREERAHYFWVAPSFVRKLTKVDSRAIEESLKWSERTPAPHLSTNRLLESKCFSRVHSRRAAGGRSEERRVGKECRSGGWGELLKKREGKVGATEEE